MKDYFNEYNYNKCIEDGFIYGNSIVKKIARKWYNPFKYLMGEITNKRINPNKISHSPFTPKR